MIVNLKNETTGQFKQSKIGFSWTMFFFGFFVPLFRGDWKWLVIVLLLDLVVGVPTLGFGLWIPNLVLSFLYNKFYVQDLVSAGFKPSDNASKDILKQKGIYSA